MSAIVGVAQARLKAGNLIKVCKDELDSRLDWLSRHRRDRSQCELRRSLTA